jgi:hypothetical protein
MPTLWFAALLLLFSNSLFASVIAENNPSLAPLIEPTPALTITVKVGNKIEVGQSDDGHRYIVPITGGSFTGSHPVTGANIKGEVIPGGADWQIDRLDNVKNIQAIYALKTNDGQTVVINNEGLVHSLFGERYAITRPVIHAPKGKYDWLNHYFWVGTITSVKSNQAVVIRLYRVSQNTKIVSGRKLAPKQRN